MDKQTYIDMFSDHSCNILVVPVNCVGTMGKGLAKEFAEHFPIYALDYRERCHHGYIKPGIVSLYYLGYGRYAANLPTKQHYRTMSKCTYISAGLQALNIELDYLGLDDILIAMPRIGCGEGGLDWDIVVKPLIEHYVTHEVLFLEP